MKSLKRGSSGSLFAGSRKLSSRGRYGLWAGAVERARVGRVALVPATTLKSVGALILSGAVDLRLNDMLARIEARETRFLPSSIIQDGNDDEGDGGPGLGRSS